MILLTSYYTDDSEDRQRELDLCLQLNLANLTFRAIILFVDGFCKIQHPTLSHIPMRDRLTYQDAFNFANRFFVGEICVLANSDIYFDESLKLIAEADLTNKFYAITRHNVERDGSLSFSDCNACQDVWVFRAPLKPVVSLFGLGTPGCDNRIAYEAKTAGLIVLNPCQIIRCHHLHLTNKRNYVQNQPVVPGPYERVEFGDQL